MSKYQETISFLFSQLPQYQKIGGKAYKADLNNIIEICELIGNPQENIKTIHVAGSNGKGSTTHMLASILQEAGYKVGLYTSPHLKDFRERIKINGKKISKKKVVEFVEQHQEIFDRIKPSFFEWTVALAFSHFQSKKTDINIIETGLGGRLDSTNILKPIVSVITNISLEHTSVLGDTLELIAKEKAGIIKENTPIVIGKSQVETEPIFREIANKKNAPIHFSDKEITKNFELGLKGKIQQENARTAVQTIKLLNRKGWEISDKNTKEGLSKVVTNTGLLGRFQLVNSSPTIILDTAHNLDGVRTVIEEISKIDFVTLHVVIGIAKDKNQSEILSQFPVKTVFYYCTSTNPRVMKSEDLKSIGDQLELQGTNYKSVKKGLKKAKSSAKQKDLILVTGSNFVVADVI